MGGLDVPDRLDDLWLVLGEFPRARPVMQGDIFKGIERPGFETNRGMVVTHACTMRAGPTLRPYLTLAPVVSKQIPRKMWRGFNDYFPLTGLDLPGMEGPGAVDLSVMTTVGTDELALDRRLLTLTDIGVQFLQQRLAFHLTRVSVDLPTLAEHCRPVLREAELEEEWVGAATAVLGDKADAEARKDFHRFLDDNDRALRGQLQDLHTENAVMRAVRREIRHRDQHDAW